MPPTTLSLHRLSRSARWRYAFLAACLPYMLLSVSFEFVHVDRVDRGVPRALHGAPVASGTLHSERTPAPEYSCAACTWLRVQPDRPALVSVGAGVLTLVASGPLPLAVAPVTRTPQPSPLRGPPVLFA